MPARYLATMVLLASSYLPTSANTTSVGNTYAWQLGWGLTDVQLMAPSGLAWPALSRGAGDRYAGARRLRTALGVRGRPCRGGGGYAGIASGLLAAAAYAVVLLMPAQSWVLAAADSYAHFATLPVGLWTLAALIELGEGRYRRRRWFDPPPEEVGPPPTSRPTDLHTTTPDRRSPARRCEKATGQVTSFCWIWAAISSGCSSA